MIKIAIIGGKLRGIEIAFLAKMAGIHAVLIDKDDLTPASGLCDENYTFDVTKKEPALLSVLKNVDFVIPAVENKDVLDAIEEIRREYDLNAAFDFTAYDVTASRIQADLLIREEKFPSLDYYPDAEPPYILKPAIGNRRRNIKRVDTNEELEFLMSRKDSPESWIAQKYVKGPIYSVEVIGKPDSYRGYGVTQVDIDSGFNSGMAEGPAGLSEEEANTFTNNVLSLAEKIKLYGIMVAEAVKDGDELKIMEINAIFPSQTPLIIFFSTGINMLVELLKVFADDVLSKKLSTIINEKYKDDKYVVLKDFQFIKKTPTFKGEVNLRTAGPLKVMVDFFDADYAITDYLDDEHDWQAVFINIADTAAELTEKRIHARETLLEHCRRQL